MTLEQYRKRYSQLFGPVLPLEFYDLPKIRPVKGDGNYQTIEPEDINPKTRIPVSRYH
jgi:hypothetical protein